MASQLSRAIDEANLGRLDGEIARLYYLDRLPLADIAARVGYDRSTVGRHVNAAGRRISGAADRLKQ